MNDAVANLSADDAKAHARAIVERSGTSFFWAMRRLPPEKRDAMFAVYAFCREVDDIADAFDAEPDVKRARLAAWRDEIEALYAGMAPRERVAAALTGPVAAFGLERDDFEAIIAGMEMDASASVRIADMAELHLYMDRVACAVGRLSNRVFGVAEEIAGPLAHSLGEALQLTNILRDVAEDAGRDRLYLPRDLLSGHGVPLDVPVRDIIRHPAAETVCEQLATLAGERFVEADSLLRRCDPATVRPAVMMMAVYRRLFEKLRRAGWSQPGARVSLSAPEKAWVALRYGLI